MQSVEPHKTASSGRSQNINIVAMLLRGLMFMWQTRALPSTLGEAHVANRRLPDMLLAFRALTYTPRKVHGIKAVVLKGA